MIFKTHLKTKWLYYLVSFCMTIGFCIVQIIDILTLILSWKCHIDLP
jgi:hypothetical protein